MNFKIYNILEVQSYAHSGFSLQKLSSFSCPVNPAIESFLARKALDFSKQKLSITYLALDEDNGHLLGFFTLAHKVLKIPGTNLSNTARRHIARFSQFDDASGMYVSSSFLLAQIGKNYALPAESRIPGTELLDCAHIILRDIQHRIGGGLIYLDCEETPQLIAFYENNGGYRRVSERISKTDSVRYLQYCKFI